MANNSSSTSSALALFCVGYESYKSAGDLMDYAVNYVIAPVSTILCFIIYALCFLGYMRLTTKSGELAYVYQSMYCAAEMLLAWSEAGFVVSRYFLSGMYKRGVEWFVRCYACMWYTAKLSLAAGDFFITLTWMFSICMAADRVFALTRPFVYRNIDHRRHHLIAFLGSVSLAFVLSIYDWFTTVIVETAPSTYKLTTNGAFTAGPGVMYATINTSIRVILAMVLVACNLATVLSYRTYTKKHATLFTTTHDKKEAKRKENERTLAFICACQSAFNALDISRILLLYIMLYVNSKLYACGDVLVFCGYVLRWVFKLIDFLFMFAVSRRFREMIFSLVRRVNSIGAGANSGRGGRNSNNLGVTSHI